MKETYVKGKRKLTGFASGSGVFPEKKYGQTGCPICPTGRGEAPMLLLQASFKHFDDPLNSI
ncbi:hypothetical protein SAMN02799630_00307 [Paenibacillus sp. UNCCL117]|nr:hypothetical protein SAMN04488602_102225 [Paenibacillus sp. cl123]SFW12697.1 hypothetical protein SAMN02799630_00307 [Paenibacillus sp. UNCCL117]